MAAGAQRSSSKHAAAGCNAHPLTDRPVQTSLWVSYPSLQHACTIKASISMCATARVQSWRLTLFLYLVLLHMHGTCSTSPCIAAAAAATSASLSWRQAGDDVTTWPVASYVVVAAPSLMVPL